MWLRSLVWCAGALAFAAAPAQYGAAPGQEAQPNNYPPALPEREGPPPRFVFASLGEIALPGPLAPSPAFVDGGRVAVPVASGVAHVAPEPDAVPEVRPAVVPAEEVGWVESMDGKRRYRTTQEGRVEAQERKSPRKRWKRDWKIVAPNSFLAQPVIVGPRLCYAGLDDLVTCVRASNGHRLFAVDVGDRISRPLGRWPKDPPEAAEILLVVPDDGASVIALDAYDGTRVATFDLPSPGRFASPALVVGSDRIALARKGYQDEEAALVLLSLTPAPAPKPRRGVPYNEASPTPSASSGR
jgi:outer membrane protein assembly factor BamB